MTDKSLQDKAISIKGKDYVLVSDRINFFNENYKNGAIKTALVSTPDAKMVVVKAQVIPDMAASERYYTGYSQATWGQGNVNTTAALENAETSAIGRALGFMGIGVIDSIASVDEMKKANVTGKADKYFEEKHWANMPDELMNQMIDEEENTLKSKCATCGSEMNHRSGIKNGKKWEALMCPNSKPGVQGHSPIWL